MSRRTPLLLIEDMIDSATRILEYTDGMTREQFAADSRTVDAVIRNFTVLGEAANRLPDEFRSQYPDFDWYRIVGLRNRVVHEYFGIDIAIVWEIRQSFLPALLAQLRTIQP